MHPDLAAIWTSTLETIAREDGRPHVHHWLRHAEPLALYENTMLIAVPNRFAGEWIEANMADELSSVVSSVMGSSVALRFVPPQEQDDAANGTSGDVVQQPMLEGMPGPRENGRARFSSAARGESAGSPVALGRPSHAAKPVAPNGKTGTATSHRLNPRYTFDSFVMGNGNQLAHAAAMAVAQAPAKAYNPLFIYGGVGLGKTHLLQAIAHHCLDQDPKPRVVYISSETFTNDLIDAISERETTEFRARYRSVDILLVDDIQFLAGKDRTQEEFFHTFNALHEANRQLVLSSDRPPKEIRTLEERLRSRFEGGLISDIQRPDFETRIAILRKKAQLQQLDVGEEVIRFIAERIQTNVREMEGALVRLFHQAAMGEAKLTVELAKEILKDLLPEEEPSVISIPLIQERVSAHFNLKVKDMKIRKRTRNLVVPRQIAMYLCRELTDASLPRIGEEFGGRDHSTVIYACDKIGKTIANNHEMAQTVERLRGEILQR